MHATGPQKGLLVHSITLLLPHAFADWEYAYIAGTGAAFFGFDIRFITPDPGTICSQGGLMTQVPDGVDHFQPDTASTLVIIGSAIWATEAAPDLTALLRAQHDAGGVLAGICGGTLPLAHAGLLDGCAHTSNSQEFLTASVASYTGQRHYVAGSRSVSSGGVITAPGTAPVSFCAEVFARSGLDAETVAQFRTMLAAEHVKR